MKFDFTDNNLNALEYEVLNTSPARIADLFEREWKRSKSQDPQAVFNTVIKENGISLSFLSCCEINRLQDKINEIINS